MMFKDVHLLFMFIFYKFKRKLHRPAVQATGPPWYKGLLLQSESVVQPPKTPPLIVFCSVLFKAFPKFKIDFVII